MTAPQLPGPDGLRASDSDRLRVTDALQRHTVLGRLSLDEYAERVDRALAARTLTELASVTGDLPDEPAQPGTAADHAPGEGRQLLLAFLLAVLALAVVGLLMVVGR